MQRKIRDLTNQTPDIDYVLDAACNCDGRNKFYMTGSSNNIQRHDYILLNNGSTTTRYLVEEINYYCNTSEVWIALLSQCE